MWNDILDALEAYDSAVLTGFDAREFPFSMRMLPQADRQQRRIYLDVPAQSRIQPGKASLLMHSHNEQLWDMTQFLIRGTLVHSHNGWYFVPQQAQGSVSAPKGLDILRSIRRMRRSAGSFLKREGLPRPKVDWKAINELFDEAMQARDDQQESTER